jgi:hypothetical protein
MFGERLRPHTPGAKPARLIGIEGRCLSAGAGDSGWPSWCLYPANWRHVRRS